MIWWPASLVLLEIGSQLAHIPVVHDHAAQTVGHPYTCQFRVLGLGFRFRITPHKP
jgi:hypothetical protein